MSHPRARLPVHGGSLLPHRVESGWTVKCRSCGSERPITDPECPPGPACRALMSPCHPPWLQLAPTSAAGWWEAAPLQAPSRSH